MNNMQRELTTQYFVPCGTYNLQTLVNFGLLDLPTAVRFSGQEPSTFDDDAKYQDLAHRMMGKTEQYGGRKVIRDTKTGQFKSQEEWESGVLALGALVRAYLEHPQDYELQNYAIDSDLATKLIESGVRVPYSGTGVFGDDFSRIVAYNSALGQSVLTDANGASSEFREALYSWHENLNPFRDFLMSSAERFAQAEPGDGLELVWGLAAYMKESLATGRLGEEVGRVIDEKLGELLGWESYFGTTPDNSDGQRIQRELRAIRTNPELVFEIYRRVDSFRNQFRNQFRDQIGALVNLYSEPQWGERTQHYAYEMRQFLRA